MPNGLEAGVGTLEAFAGDPDGGGDPTGRKLTATPVLLERTQGVLLERMVGRGIGGVIVVPGGHCQLGTGCGSDPFGGIGTDVEPLPPALPA